jgi:hypothetical protein
MLAGVTPSFSTAGALTVRGSEIDADARFTLILASVWTPTGRVEIAKVAVTEPAGTVTDLEHLADGLLLARLT